MALTAPITDAPSARGGLQRRCHALGITLLTVDTEGRAAARSTAPTPEIVQSILESPMFAAGLRRAAAAWATQVDPRPTLLWPGCWLIPLALRERRRLVGYHVAVMLSHELIYAEEFHPLCDSARLDRRAAAQRLELGPAVGPAEVDRLSTLLRWMSDDLTHVDRGAEEIGGLSRQLGETYEELSLVYKLSAHMTVTQDPRTFLEEVCAEIQQVVGFNWLAMQITDDEERLQTLAGQTVVAGNPPADRKNLGEIARQLMGRLGKGDPRIVDDTAELDVPGLTRVAARLLAVPIVVQGKCIAIVVGADKMDGSALSSVDSKLVTSTAHNMAIFLENAMLYEDMQDMFMGMLHSLIAAIDAKDSYTCGHSERVAWLSRQLAHAAGLDTTTVERVYLSALVHDVGKIGVPEAVLCKPGKLTDEEFEMIKAHPEIGVRILKDIRQMQDLVPGVLHHHERFDGRGYPHKLKGHDIPLFGRLIALADSFDAMSSNRTYRRAMPLEQVLAEIERCAGAQFDPELVKYFVKLDFAPFQRMVTEHQQRQSPLNKAMRNSA
jgi:HD-GYP domain-containing protein (c-di-GMP phosphodiesterase class II)